MTIAIQEVSAVFQRLPSLRSQPEKLAVLKRIFQKASAGDIKYIIKIMTGDLRIGLKESLVEEAIAKAFARPLESVRRANMLTGDLAETLRAARKGRACRRRHGAISSDSFYVGCRRGKGG